MTPPHAIVVVTGGSRGLGLGIVNDLLSHGFDVATCSRKPSQELEDAKARLDQPNRLFWHACQVGNPKEETQFMDAVIDWAQARPLYGLVNNAGIARDGVLATFPNASTEAILQTNLAGALRMARLTLRQFLQQPTPARIINISSIVGSRGYTGLAAYAATKAGLDGMTRALARETGRRQITVNSVAPGFLETELSSGLEERQRQQIVKRTPLKRLGRVEDIVPVIRFLLSPEASFVTGQTWTVDGGLTC